jgi:hypothetical protein
MTVKKTKGKTKVKARAESVPTEPQAYLNHRPGRRKGRIHALFDEHGSETAWTAGLKAKLKPGTLRAWFSAWKRLQSKSKTTAKGTNSVNAPVSKSEVAAAA